jgi:hypothetical protein
VIMMNKERWERFSLALTSPGDRWHAALHRIPSSLRATFSTRNQKQKFSGHEFAHNSWRYQIFWEVVGLERDPLSLVSTVEELLERKSSSSRLEIREYGRRGSAALATRQFSIRKEVDTNFADKCRSLGRYSSLVYSGHEVFFFFLFGYILQPKFWIAVTRRRCER